MKMKSISKIMAVALTAMMTLTLTSCEDETVPAYGTGVESDGGVHHNLSPNPPAETESETGMVEGYIRGCGVGYDDEVGEYIWVTAFVTSHYSEKIEVWRVVNTSIYDDAGLRRSYITLPSIPDDSYNLDMLIKPETPTMVSWAFSLPNDSEYIIAELVESAYSGDREQNVLDTIQSYLTEN